MSGKYLDIANQRFNRLIALKIVGKQGNEYLWDCLCDCGNHKTVSVSLLRSGRTKSCGCLKQETDRSAKGNEIDLTGQTFGMLTVIRSVGSDKRGEKLWECQCACGNPNHSIVLGSNLRKRTHCSCGCARMSTGEIIIANLLIDNHIPFLNEYKPFKFENTNCYARFDFFVDNKYFIEFDGETHYVNPENTHGWCTEKSILKQQKRDVEKTQWCDRNRIPLIRIPYTIRENLSLDDLLLTKNNNYIVSNEANVYFDRQDMGYSDRTLKLQDWSHSINIDQFDLNGNFIRNHTSWDTILKVPHTCKPNIKKCCNHELKTCAGFVWRFVDN